MDLDEIKSMGQRVRVKVEVEEVQKMSMA